MILRLRLIWLLARPAVVILLAFYTAIGLAAAGQGQNQALFAACLVVVVGYLLFAVAVNDIADERIDRVNLPGDPRRPLASGSARRAEVIVTGVVGAVLSLGVAAALGWRPLLVVATGLTVAAGYSLRPVRLADRGGLASVILPVCYVVVPFLCPLLAVRPGLRPTDLLLLGGLYVGFIGRILLKDFRDVRGDALFGKRTFVVRRGRATTCWVSAGCWLTGSAVTAAVAGGVCFAASFLAAAIGALVLLRRLALDAMPRREEAIISALAMLGRGQLMLLAAQLGMQDAGWSGGRSALVICSLTALVASQTVRMARRGPSTRATAAPLMADVRSAELEGRGWAATAGVRCAGQS